MPDTIQPRDSLPREKNGAGADSERAALVQKWLQHFGVDYADELDLGTLAAIKHCIDDGLSPPAKASSASRPPRLESTPSTG